MQAELRADGLHIFGYVNVPGRDSRPVVTKRGKVIERIEQRAFQRAIDRAGNLDLKLDHERVIASMANGTLEAHEDNVGLRAESTIKDEEVIKAAREGKLKGWSFDMSNVKDEIEERSEDLPIRKVKDFDMSEISLVFHKNPVYSSTSIELRAGTEEEVETRAELRSIDFVDKTPKYDNSAYKEKLKKITGGE